MVAGEADGKAATEGEHTTVCAAILEPLEPAMLIGPSPPSSGSPRLARFFFLCIFVSIKAFFLWTFFIVQKIITKSSHSKTSFNFVPIKAKFIKSNHC